MTDSMSDLLKQAQKMQLELTQKQEEMKSVTGGLPLPPGMKLPF